MAAILLATTPSKKKPDPCSLLIVHTAYARSKTYVSYCHTRAPTCTHNKQQPSTFEARGFVILHGFLKDSYKTRAAG